MESVASSIQLKNVGTKQPQQNNQNKCSDRNMKEQNPAHLGNYDRVTDRPTNQPTDGQTGS